MALYLPLFIRWEKMEHMMENPIPLETPGPVQKIRRFLLPAVLLIATLTTVAVVGSYAWFYRYNTCEVEAVKDATHLLAIQLERYDHAYQFATSASRGALTRPVNVLQQISMDTQEIAVPACMRTVKNELVSYMGSVIYAFQAFMAEETDSTIRALLEQSDRHYENFTAEMETVNQCAPFCAPWD